MVPQRIGSVSGRNTKGELRTVSVYRDGAGFKLCGPNGSLMVADLDAVLATVANRYTLTDTALSMSQRAA